MPAASDRPHSSGSADDAGAAPETPALPARFRPLGVRLAGWFFAVALLVVGAVVWVTIPQVTRDAFTLPQRVTVVGFYLVGVALCHAMGRCRVDADADGVLVVNGYRARRLSWPQVVAVRLPPGNPWATLDLADGTSLAAMGIQGSDGRLARRQVQQLRGLIDAHAGHDPRG
jgi:hypothetical protein